MAETTQIKIISTLEMSHEEWLARRQFTLGASETAAAIGIDEWKTKYQLYLEKVEGQKKKPSAASRGKMEGGLRAENMISDWIGDKYGLTIRRDNKIRIHPRLPYWTCNLDRVIVGRPCGPMALELKTTSKESLKTWSIHASNPSPIFMHHWVQVQTQLAITGWSVGAIGVMPADSYLGFGEPILFEIERDDEFLPGLEESVKDFWENNVLAKIPPEVKTIEDFKHRYPVASPPPMEISLATLKEILNLQELKGKISETKKTHDALDLQIKIMLSKHDGAIFEGTEILTFRNNKQTVFDAEDFEEKFPGEAKNCMVIDPKKVEEEYPDLHLRFTRSNENGPRVLRLKKKALAEISDTLGIVTNDAAGEPTGETEDLDF